MSGFVTNESIFSNKGLNHQIPTKPISQIIDLNQEKEEEED
jgi:hypothetical protein